MAQLIKITSIPVKMRITSRSSELVKVENAAQMANLKNKASKTAPSREIRDTVEITGKSDHTEYAGAGLSDGGAVGTVGEYAKYTPKPVPKLAQAPMPAESSIPDTLSSMIEQLGEDFESITAAVPDVPVASADNGGETVYIPGGLDVEIVQRAKVIVEYVGGHNYVPPSSDPNYVEK